MAGIKDQKKLTGGKGFKNVKKMPLGSFFTYPGEVVRTITEPMTHLKNVISNSRINKKRGGKV